MYKVLIFLKKTDEENIISHFRDFLVKFFSDLTKKKIEIGIVESNPLLEVKYSHFIQLDFESKEKWQKLFGNETGEELKRDLLDFHKFITMIFIDYEHLPD